MTLTDVLKDFAYLSTLLLIGFELRRRIRIFQKYFIPSALIAGTIGMFLGPSWLGTVSPVYIPFSGGIGQWSGALVIFVCATMFLGLELNKVGRDGMAATFFGRFLPSGPNAFGTGYCRGVRSVYCPALSIRLHGRLGVLCRARQRHNRRKYYPGCRLLGRCGGRWRNICNNWYTLRHHIGNGSD